MEDDPDADPQLLQREVDLTAQQLAASNRRLTEILEEINEATEDLDEISDELQDATVSRLEINNRLDNLLEMNRQILNDIARYNPQILQGFQIGTTLGLVLSGYFFPTYIDIDDDKEFIKADNINYNPDFIKKQKEQREKRKKSNKPKPLKDLQAGKITAGEGISSRIQQPIVRSFIPVKSSSNGKPLTYQQIQDYKSTLNEEELSRLRGKMLIFGENKKVFTKDDKCKSVQGTNIINKIPVRI